MTSLFGPAEFSDNSVTWLVLLAATFVKGVFILLMAAALGFSLKRASAAARHLVWSLALASLLALPLLTFVLPGLQVRALPGWTAASSVESAPSAAAPTGAAPNLGASSVASDAASEKPAPRQPVAAPVNLQPIVMSPDLTPQSPLAAQGEAPASERGPVDRAALALVIWVTVAMMIIARLMMGTVGIWWVARRARKITDDSWADLEEALSSQLGLADDVLLLESERVSMPLTCGILRPAVLLPADAREWSTERRQVVLLHELAHVKRRDCLTQMLAQVTCALYWFNPLVWIAARQLRIERERACDDQVLDAGMKASDYANHLLDIARSFNSAKCSSLAAVAIARRSQLEGRLLAILDPKLRRRGLNRLLSAFVGLLIACVVLPLAALRPVAQAKDLPGAGSNREPLTPAPQAAPDRKSPSVAAAPLPAIAQPAGQPAREDLNPPAGVEGLNPAQPAQPEQGGQEDRTVAQAARPSEQKVDNAAVDALIDALKDDDPEVREHALFALTQIGGPRMAEILAQAMKDPNPDIREKAAWGLGIKGGAGVVELLITALRDSSGRVREQAAWALGLQGDKRAIEPLTAALRDENPEVREKAAWALGLRGDSGSVEPLMAALKDSNKDVRGMAAWALGMKGDQRAMKALSAAFKDPDKEVRQKAAWALGMLLMRGHDADGVDTDKDDEDEEGASSVNQVNVGNHKIKVKSKVN